MTDKEYTATPADEAIYAGLLTTQAIGAIQQAYTDGKIVDLETYNKLYEAAEKAHLQVYKLAKILEEKREIHTMTEAFRKASRSSSQEKEE